MSAIFLDSLQDMTHLWRAVAQPGDPEIVINYCDGQPENIPALLGDHSVCIIDHTFFDADLLAKCTKLKRIVFLGTGAASFVDLAAAAKCGIAVDTIKGYGDTTVAEHTIALAFAAARSVAKMDREVRAGVWKQSEGVQLLGKTMGVVGMGGIGKEVARIAQGMGMKVAAWNRSPQPDSIYPLKPLDEVLATSDILCACLALNDQTRGFLDREKLAKTKQGVIFVNTARADVVNQGDLVELLKSGHIRHAALDVFTPEPPHPEDPLLHLDNVTVTSHAGFNTPEATMKMFRIAIDLTIAGLK